VVPFTRKKPTRAPLPADLPRHRVVVPAPESCPCCNGADLKKIGETITESREVVPRQWIVVQTVREKFICKACETITQPPAPFHPIPRASAGPNLLAMVLFNKFGLHQPLNRQSETYAAEGMSISVSTLADYVGHGTVLLRSLVDLIEAHILAGERIYHDDTTVPVMAAGKTMTGRIWASVRDDRPFGGTDPPLSVITTRATVQVPIRSDSWLGMPVSCRLTLIPATTRSTPQAANQDPSWRLPAGHTPVARSSRKPA